MEAQQEQTFYDPKQANLECDGMDQRRVNPFDYLAENLTYVSLAYLTEKLK